MLTNSGNQEQLRPKGRHRLQDKAPLAPIRKSRREIEKTTLGRRIAIIYSHKKSPLDFPNELLHSMNVRIIYRAF